MTSDPRDGDDPVLERLSERLEDGPRELRKLVEQEDTVMRECAGMSLERTEEIAGWSARPERSLQSAR